MISNLEKYKTDLERLINKGGALLNAMQFEFCPEQFEEVIRRVNKKTKENKIKFDEFEKSLPSFRDEYQSWYSESLSVVKLLLPDRIDDFVKLYGKPKGRKEVTCGSYVIEDYLQNLRVLNGLGEKIVSPEAAIPQFQQQLNILKSVLGRFESSLFDIKQLMQADLFDSELDAAMELNKKGFCRGAGAMVGVVLEFHLIQVCEKHSIKIVKKEPTISDLNDLLKANNVIEISVWRFIQRLGDLRNKCDHNKKIEPTKQDVEELIDGVDKIMKSIF